MVRAENEDLQLLTKLLTKLLAKLLARALRCLDFSPACAIRLGENRRSSEGVRNVFERPPGLEIPCSIHLSYGRVGVFRVSGDPL